ncbi:hypothetical protein ACJMK2_014149 [Sinanodonta woodiana]|uniref:SWIM-type domain-containing protein n=1 Tax=Sinanodonta woodiana TaxID=1069815 RepID=A0ABD3UZT1_SINWO
MLPQILMKFNIGTILSYFLETSAVLKAIRESSLSCLHLVIYMKQFYRVILMPNAGGGIHASCSCPAGSGHNCICKHTAVLCYALEDCVKLFVLPEDIPSCTDKLEAGNKPRQVKLPAVPLREKRNDLQIKEQPEAYKLNKVCDTERTFAELFLCELEQWSKESNNSKKLLINTVASQDAPVETLVSVNPLYDYIDWFTLRQLRITGSIVSRIWYFFMFMNSIPNTISNAILEPSTFFSPTVINRYVAEKVKEGSWQYRLTVELIKTLVGIVECKVAVKGSHQTVVECAKDPGYPLNSMKINQHGTSVQDFGLKPIYAWSFANYCDLVLLHPDSGSFYCH